MTPEDWDRLADKARAAALARAQQGDPDGAARESELDEMYRAVAEKLRQKLDRLPGASHADNVSQMTRDQLARRGRAVAASKTRGHPVLEAMSADPRFGGLRQWCTSRRENRSSVSAYLSGRRNMPQRVYDKITKDFPGLDWEPPRAVVR